MLTWASHGGETHRFLNVALVLAQAKWRNLSRNQDEACDNLRQVKPLLIDVNTIKHVHKRILLDKAVTLRQGIQLVFWHQDGLNTVL